MSWRATRPDEDRFRRALPWGPFHRSDALEIAKALGMRRSTAVDALRRLVNRGLVRVAHEGRRDPLFWRA